MLSFCPLWLTQSKAFQYKRPEYLPVEKLRLRCLLIELNEGQLVWSSYRRSKAAQKSWQLKTTLEFPSWAEVEEEVV